MFFISVLSKNLLEQQNCNTQNTTFRCKPQNQQQSINLTTNKHSILKTMFYLTVVFIDLFYICLLHRTGHRIISVRSSLKTFYFNE